MASHLGLLISILSNITKLPRPDLLRWCRANHTALTLASDRLRCRRRPRFLPGQVFPVQDKAGLAGQRGEIFSVGGKLTGGVLRSVAFRIWCVPIAAHTRDKSPDQSDYHNGY